MKETLGRRVKRLRQQAGLSRPQLAELARLNPSHIGLIENGDRKNPKGDTLTKLAQALETSVDFLLTGEHGRAA